MFKVRIRELRESAGYKSQQSFADAFGVAQSTVGNWEAGKREPNFQTLMRLADFLIRRLITFWAVPVKRLFPGLISPPTTSRMWGVPFWLPTERPHQTTGQSSIISSTDTHTSKPSSTWPNVIDLTRYQKKTRSTEQIFTQGDFILGNKVRMVECYVWFF